MYTYGAPRVGNGAFAASFNERLAGASWRITNASDIVPSVPRLMGYAHVQTGVELSSSGGYVIEQACKDVLGEGKEFMSVVQVSVLRALFVMFLHV